jgi:Tfp pilus assembly protein PilO
MFDIKFQKNLYLVIALITIIALAFVFVIQPLTSNLVKQYAKMLEKSSKAGSIQDKYSALQDAYEKYDLIREANDNFLKFIPNKRDNENFMLSLEAVAKDTGTTLPEVSINEPANDATTGLPVGVSNVVFEITVKGKYAQVLKFIQKTERLQRFNQISEVSLDQQEDSLSASIKLSSFYKK